MFVVPVFVDIQCQARVIDTTHTNRKFENSYDLTESDANSSNENCLGGWIARLKKKRKR